MESIEQLRQKIADIDAEIIEKIGMRQELSKQIGHLKLQAGKVVIDRLQEKKRFESYAALCEKYHLPYAFIKRVFTLIIAHSRGVQRT